MSTRRSPWPSNCGPAAFRSMAPEVESGPEFKESAGAARQNRELGQVFQKIGSDAGEERTRRGEAGSSEHCVPEGDMSKLVDQDLADEEAQSFEDHGLRRKD